jgi:predicted DNA-binding transcriptional regulator AlpA
MPRYIRPKQLEEQYGIDRVTAWRWYNNDRLKFPKPIRLSPGFSVYDVDEILAWIESKRHATAVR